MLRSSGEFVRYCVSVAVQKIQQLEETGHTDGPDGLNSTRTFRFLCEMTRYERVTAFLQSETRPCGDPVRSPPQRAHVALLPHPRRRGRCREEGQAVQSVPAVSGRSAQDLHNLPAPLSRQDAAAAVCHRSVLSPSISPRRLLSTHNFHWTLSLPDVSEYDAEPGDGKVTDIRFFYIQQFQVMSM